MSFFKKSLSLLEQTQNLPAGFKSMYINWLALRRIIASEEAAFAIVAENNPARISGPAAETPEFAFNDNVQVHTLSQSAAQLVTARATLAALEALPAFAKAKAACEPLHIALNAELKAQAEERERIARELNKHREELAAAERAASENPAVTSARKKVSEFTERLKGTILG